MATKIFVNLPVKDLKKTMEFFTVLGFKFNSKFTDENAACMIISEDHIYAMLLVEKFFKSFIKKEIADAKKSTEVLLALSVESRGTVDQMMKLWLEAGGKEAREKQDLGFIYSRALEDLDGHIWEIFYMDESRMPKK
ncbi:glyoxalase/bleomycin resistance/extradiol dioxygenase family protein [Candidatus Micrarchaeota archaeon]|nr:glyoxalase/bleomycin resistance/extradiol dioxygenase family protein [Candidatus Micrarchaeota archaeon]